MTNTEKQIKDMGYEIRVIDMLNAYVVYARDAAARNSNS